MPDQLRMYTIKPGEMAAWLKEWRQLVAGSGAAMDSRSSARGRPSRTNSSGSSATPARRAGKKDASSS